MDTPCSCEHTNHNMTTSPNIWQICEACHSCNSGRPFCISTESRPTSIWLYVEAKITITGMINTITPKESCLRQQWSPSGHEKLSQKWGYHPSPMGLKATPNTYTIRNLTTFKNMVETLRRLMMTEKSRVEAVVSTVLTELIKMLKMPTTNSRQDRSIGSYVLVVTKLLNDPKQILPLVPLLISLVIFIFKSFKKSYTHKVLN